MKLGDELVVEQHEGITLCAGKRYTVIVYLAFARFEGRLEARNLAVKLPPHHRNPWRQWTVDGCKKRGQWTVLCSAGVHARDNRRRRSPQYLHSRTAVSFSETAGFPLLVATRPTTRWCCFTPSLASRLPHWQVVKAQR